MASFNRTAHQLAPYTISRPFRTRLGSALRNCKANFLHPQRAIMNTKAAETAPLIDVRDLVKRYDDKLVLNGFNLTVQRGETCVIISAPQTLNSAFISLSVS